MNRKAIAFTVAGGLAGSVAGLALTAVPRAADVAPDPKLRANRDTYPGCSEDAHAFSVSFYSNRTDRFASASGPWLNNYSRNYCGSIRCGSIRTPEI